VRLGAEVWLMLLALALYVVDALLLLASNEAVLVRGWRRRWRAGFGAHGWKLAAKEPYLPNPLTPHRPLLRLSWAFDAEPPRATSAEPLTVPPEIDTFGPFTIVSLLCIFVGLPIGLFTGAGVAFTAGAVVLLYLNNLVALGLVFKRRGKLNLSQRQFALMAFECLACPPFSINLVRKLCARVPVEESFTSVARRTLPADELAVVNAQCLLRLEEQLAYAPEGGAQMQALQAARTRFTSAEEP